MVAQRTGIVPHPVHRTYLHAPAIKIKIRCSLTEITGIEQQQVLVCHPLASDNTHPARITALAVRFGLYLRMGVVGVKNRQMILRGTRRQKNDGAKYHV